VFEARNHQAKASVAIIVGTTMASMISTEPYRMERSAADTGPAGSSTPDWHPARAKGARMTMRGVALIRFGEARLSPVINNAHRPMAGASSRSLTGLLRLGLRTVNAAEPDWFAFAPFFSACPVRDAELGRTPATRRAPALPRRVDTGLPPTSTARNAPALP